jgi:predicted O-methyltransferase YrrM
MLDLWTAVDRYITDSLLPPDPALDGALHASTAEGLPAIHVSPAQGKLLMLLARIHGARSILEIGTLGGYSAIWLARALPAGGRLVSLEVNPEYAKVARDNVARAGLGHAVDIRVGRAIDSLPKLAAEGGPPFDLFFIDADKPSNPDYLAWAMRLARPGSVIVVDNVVREGAVIDAASTDASVQGTRRLFERLGAEKRVTATAIQTVGIKGYDGFAIALVERVAD